MAGKMMFKDSSGAGGPSGGGTKPWENPEGGVPPMPNSPAPPGYQWQLQTGPDGQKFWGIVAAAAIGAIGSYLSAQQANKPRTGSTNQTTTQTPYLAGMIQPDLEAILSYQRQLINQGPAYVGPQATWPQYQAPSMRFAPGPVEPPRQYVHQPRPAEDYPPGYTPPPFGGAGPGNQGGRGGPGSEPYGDPGEANSPDAYLKGGGRSRFGGELGNLDWLRALFASAGGRR